MSDSAAAMIMRDYDHLVATLRVVRRSRRISQRELAGDIGSSQSSISAWLTGKQELPGMKLFDMADALGYDLALIKRAAP